MSNKDAGKVELPIDVNKVLGGIRIMIKRIKCVDTHHNIKRLIDVCERQQQQIEQLQSDIETLKQKHPR